MTRSRASRVRSRGATVACGALAIAGCAHLTYGGGPVAPTPASGSGSPVASPIAAPAPTATPTSGSLVPQTCATQSPGATAFVAMGGAISATSVAPYGTIFGYAVATSIATLPNVAAPIALRASDVVQFVNVESGAPTPIAHSAVGFPGATAFPPVPVVFPVSLEQPTGTTIAPNAWSTGTIAPQCFSREFALSPGTYYFGDLSLYNLTNFRNVVVVSR